MNTKWKYLMHIGFDNSSRLIRNLYYFEYKDIRFKLIQNNHKYKDVLLSVLPSADDNDVEKVYDIASEYLSALAWEDNSFITVRHIGGHSSGNVKNLKRARCSSYTFRTIPKGYGARGYNINRIPQIENNNQKLALALFREASSSLNPYLGFLFYWHILEISQNPQARINWINYIYKSNKVYIDDYYIKQLYLGNKSLGEYFHDDCRHSIAHVVRGKRTLKLDSYLATSRISISAKVIEYFAKYYIENNLNLKRTLYLARNRGIGFPTYMNEDELETGYFTIAYGKK